MNLQRLEKNILSKAIVKLILGCCLTMVASLQATSASGAFLIVYLKELEQTAPEQYVLIADNINAGTPVSAPGSSFNNLTATHSDVNADVGVIDIGSSISYLGGWTIAETLTASTFSLGDPSEGVFFSFEITRTGSATKSIEAFATRGFEANPATAQSLLYGGGQVTEGVLENSLDFDGGLDIGGDAFNISAGSVTLGPTYNGVPNAFQDYSFSNVEGTPPSTSVPAGSVSLTVGTTVQLAENQFFGTQMSFEALNLSSVPEPGSMLLAATAAIAGGVVPAMKRLRNRSPRKTRPLKSCTDKPASMD